jgi:NADH:ubiquinone oxidoreductase subunit F (NADH-binding)/NADH:ubiquinone oxidoreductase subunit E
MIIQELNLIQERCGWLPDEELRALARRIAVPLHRLHEVASFYPLYRRSEPPKVDVRVCRDMTCHLRNARSIRRELESVATELGGGKAQVNEVSCLGQCDRPVAVSINDHVYRGWPVAKLRELIVAAASDKPLPHDHADNAVPRWRIDPYEGLPRYDAVRQFVANRNVDALLEKLRISGLRGMGGAGFPTEKKWAAVRGAPGSPKYIVCNADESEPGTFKDRELLRLTPYLVIEGMVLAALVTGATQGIIYVRHEYHEEIEAVEAAVEQARSAGICGDNVLGSGQAFSLEVFVSPGGYVQGEESALLEALEDRRGEPRNKPPFPVFQGLFGKPTVINNVETLAWVPRIALEGGEWYRDQGTHGATGLRFVSISGDVNRPGVYEVPLGQTVRELLFDTAGGMRDGQALKALATSGPSGGFLPARLRAADLPLKFVADRLKGAEDIDLLDVTLDFGTMGAMGAMLGAACIVYGDRADLVENALNCVEFYRNESCGKCVPCRVGSQKLVDVLTDLLAGRLRQDEAGREVVGLVRELAETMNITSICGLGMVAANPITSIIKFFPEDLDRYLPKGWREPGVKG